MQLHRPPRWKLVAAATCCALLLAGCGGGTDRPAGLAGDEDAPAQGAAPVGPIGVVSVSVPPSAPANPSNVSPINVTPGNVVPTNVSPGAIVATPGTTGVNACAPAAQRARIRNYMDDQYFWFANQGQPNDAAASIDAYFQSLLFRPADRYSYTQSTEAFNQFFNEGRRIGYGYTLVWTDAALTQMRFRQIEPDSPMSRAGIQRGDTVLSIDEYSPALVANGILAAVDTPGVPRVFRIRTALGQERRVTVVSEDFALSPVQSVKIFDLPRNGTRVKVGYLAYQQFVTYGDAGLAAAFEAFTTAGVHELILDLRYNGGGNVYTARDLAHMVGGAQLSAKTFAQLRFNSKHADANYAIRFAGVPELLPAMPLSLARVVVIASGSTASASELLINGLKPYMDVVLVGATTYGKPYGFQPQSSCGTTYNVVNFESVNAQGAGGFINGIAPTCAVDDDLDHALGDPLESRIQAGLAYIANGACGGRAPALGRARAAPFESPVFGEVPASQMFLQ